jgi:hypothetical protein
MKSIPHAIGHIDVTNYWNGKKLDDNVELRLWMSLTS